MKPKLANLEGVTLGWVLGARAVRASDGSASQVLWENPDSGATTDDLFIRVRQMSPAYVGPVLEKLRQMSIDTASDVR